MKKEQIKKSVPFIFLIVSFFMLWILAWLHEIDISQGAARATLYFYMACQLACIIAGIAFFVKAPDKTLVYKRYFYLTAILATLWWIGLWIYMDVMISFFNLFFSPKNKL